MRRDLMKAGSAVRLRMTALSNGWRVEARYLDGDGCPVVAWRHRDGAVYLTGDAEQMPSPLAERVRVLGAAFFDGCCPACGASGGYVEGTPTDALDRMQFVTMGAATGGAAVTGDVAFAIEHAEDCPGRPGAIALDGAANSN
jgi:hypothetical protein